MPFKLRSEYKPQGDQPRAISELTAGLKRGDRHQTLLGVTGSGKTFSIANVVAQVQRPTLVIAHNKTLAGQLFGEFKELFPENAVEFFVSYYDYYQPEAYVPTTDTYIEKDSSINDEIDRMRHAATHSLLTRNDVLIVASVSCIYGLGTAEAYYELKVSLETGREYPRHKLLRDLVEIQYERNDTDFSRGTFRVKGDTLEIFPAYEEERAIRVELFGDTVESIKEIDPLRGKVLAQIEKMSIFPSSHYVTSGERRRRAILDIREELRERLGQLREQNKLLEAQRLEQRTMFDLEMIEQMGYCQGIENYSRHLSGRKAGEAPPCLLDYFPKDYLLVIDESHQTVPQIGAMYRGDRSRKETLVEYGFRLPSALDNRPLQFAEWEKMVNQAVFVSATPAEYELQRSEGVIVEQIIRPTGLIDPEVEVRPVASQVDDLLEEVRKRAGAGQRVLVTTLTKRMAEDLTEYYADLGVKVRYMHSDIDTLERLALVRDLRRGVFDVLVGINLLRGAHPGRPRDPLRRNGDRLDEGRARGDGPPPRQAEGLQRGARHHSAERQAGHPRHADPRHRHRCRRCARRQGGAGGLPAEGQARRAQADRAARSGDAREGRGAGLRGCGHAPGQDPGHQGPRPGHPAQAPGGPARRGARGGGHRAAAAPGARPVQPAQAAPQPRRGSAQVGRVAGCFPRSCSGSWTRCPRSPAATS